MINVVVLYDSGIEEVHVVDDPPLEEFEGILKAVEETFLGNDKGVIVLKPKDNEAYYINLSKVSRVNVQIIDTDLGLDKLNSDI